MTMWNAKIAVAYHLNSGITVNIWLKYLITTGLVVVISEIAKRSDRLGALFSLLPLMTLLILFWLFFEKQPQDIVKQIQK